MNKVFVFGLLALVAACAAAPTDSIEPVGTMPAELVGGYKQDKRSIIYRAPVHYRTLPFEYPGYGYEYDYPGYYRSAYSYPHYGQYVI